MIEERKEKKKKKHNLSHATGSREILYRVELPYMEELTLVYLEKEGDDNNDELSKSMVTSVKPSVKKKTQKQRTVGFFFV